MFNKDGVTTGALKTSVQTQKSSVRQDSPGPPEQSGRSVFDLLFSQVGSPICVTVQLIWAMLAAGLRTPPDSATTLRTWVHGPQDRCLSPVERAATWVPGARTLVRPGSYGEVPRTRCGRCHRERHQFCLLEPSVSEQPAASADHARQQLEPTAADGLRAYAVKTRASAEQFAAVLEDIAENGLLSMSPRRARSTRSAWSRTSGQAPACAFGSSENVVVHLRRANLTSHRPLLIDVEYMRNGPADRTRGWPQGMRPHLRSRSRVA